jgi:CrcB protein
VSAATLLLVALGGALGSVLRALAGLALPAGRLPWATIAVNLAGSLAIGWLMARFAGGGAGGEGGMSAHAFWIVGVCGGFTTFSAFSWQTFEHLQRGAWGVAAANVVLSVGLCLAGTWAGWKIAQ